MLLLEYLRHQQHSKLIKIALHIRTRTAQCGDADLELHQRLPQNFLPFHQRHLKLHLAADRVPSLPRLLQYRSAEMVVHRVVADALAKVEIRPAEAKRR